MRSQRSAILSTGALSPEEIVTDEAPKPNPFAKIRWSVMEQPVEGVWAERRRLAAAMRTVIERLIASDAPETELREAANRLEQYGEHLGTHPRRKRYEGIAESALAQLRESGEMPPAAEVQRAIGPGHFDFSPLIGRSNPLAPPITLREENGRVVGEATFGSAYEGPPNCLHGGYVAAAFDEVLGFAQSLTGAPGMTGRLDISYRSPTPLHTLLHFDAWVEGVEGRKIPAKSTLKTGDRLCAEATGLFITIRPGYFEKLMKERDQREGT
jgi:acyl-coenzyme A thioesterase PaaI-like protein